jgi:hypothetical protein
MEKEIGWYKEPSDNFICSDCFSKMGNFNMDGYKPIGEGDLGNNIYSCDGCGKEVGNEKENIAAPDVAPVYPKTPIEGEVCRLPGFRQFFTEAILTYKNNFWAFLVISALPFVTSLLLSRLFLTGGLSFILIIPVYIAVIIISVWSSLSLLYTVKERESKIGIVKALAKGWACIGPGIWISFLSFIIIAAGFVLFIIPGVIFSIWYLLALYVLVNEDKKGMDALRRSKELISGYVAAYWGRTLLLGLVLMGVLLPLYFFINIASRFMPGLSYIANIASMIVTPLSVIFSFLVYENIKKAKESGCSKSPKETKYVLIALLLFLLPIAGILASIVIVNVSGVRQKANDVYTRGNLEQMRALAEFIYDNNNNNYSGVSCDNTQIVSICGAIKEKTGQNPVIYSSKSAYCAYAKLKSGDYYCIDSLGNAGKSKIFPDGTGYCNGITFVCPYGF